MIDVTTDPGVTASGRRRHIRQHHKPTPLPAGERRESVIEMRTGQVRPMIPQTPQLTSAEAPWHGVLLEEHELGELETGDVATVNHVVGLQLSGPVSVEWQSSGNRQSLSVVTGHIGILPAGLVYSCRSRCAGRVVTVSLEPHLVARASYETAEGNGVELAPALLQNDTLIEGIVMALRTELVQGGSGGRIYGESLAATLAVHLLHRYAAHPAKFAGYDGGLARHQLRRAIDFIHEHLEEDISLEAIARAAGMSPFHFCRMFKKSTRQSPHQYVLRSRVERAKQLLLDPSRSIAAVAHQLGFCDQSHLAIHFKRAFGITPRSYVRQLVMR